MKKKLVSLAIAALLVLTTVGSAAADKPPPGQSPSHCQPPTRPPSCSGHK